MLNENCENSDSEDPDFVADIEHNLTDDSMQSENEDTVNNVDGASSILNKKKIKYKCRKYNGSNKKNKVTKETVPDIKSKNSELLSNSEEKTRADALWESFLNDTASSCKNQYTNLTTSSTKNLELHHSNSQQNTSTCKRDKHTTNLNMSTNKEIVLSNKYDFKKDQQIGFIQRRKIIKQDLSSILNTVGKKPKLTTLEKSKLDWNKYKEENNLQDEISTFNRGKSGYLEKQDFLSRTDSRQFELEKGLRNSNKRKL